MWLWWVLVSFGFLVVSVIPDCEVIVHEPWPTQYIFVPSDSRVRINCTSNPMTSFWLVVFAEDPYQNRFSDEADRNTLHDRGVYEIPSVNTPLTLGLLINDTARNNGTEILCTKRDQGVTVTVSNTIFVFQPVSFSLEVLEKKNNAVNISWSHDSSVPVSDNFLLTVSDGQGSEVVTQTLSESHYYFNVSDSTSPCEVYTFSVSASYSFAGATYTGEGCAITGTKSMMLPSLPNITRLESSIKYVLKKTSLEFILVVSFQAASYCEQYPVLNYTLEVKGPCSDVLSQSVSPGVENVIHNLTENTIYSFSVLISNSVGVVSTNRSQIFTTDVQNVTATPVETMDGFIVQCDFITGSNAQGCMVVLVGEVDNVTANVSNLEENCSKEVNVSYPLSCYHEIFAFDIESDGSAGTLAVPGKIVTDLIIDIPKLCDTQSTTPSTTPRSQTTLIISVTVYLLVLMVIISVLVVILIVYCNLRRCQEVNETNIHMKPNEVYGVISGGSEIKVTPNEVYGVSLSSQIQ